MLRIQTNGFATDLHTVHHRMCVFKLLTPLRLSYLHFRFSRPLVTLKTGKMS